MKVKFEALFDEYLPEHKDIQGKLFDLVGIHNGRVLCTDASGDKWSFPSNLVSSVLETQ